MTWLTTVLPTSLAKLQALEWLLLVAALAFGILAALAGFLATQVANHRGDLEKALIERRLAPRRVSDAQRATVVQALARAPRGAVLVQCVLGDGEGFAFATQVADTLRAAGWTVTDVHQAVYTGHNPVGFGLIVRSKDQPPPGAETLFAALLRAGLPIGAADNADLPADQIVILVGNKPRE